MLKSNAITKKAGKWTSNPVFHFAVFCLMLIVLPYAIFNTYNQTSIRLISNATFSLFGADIPIILLILIGSFTVFVIRAWARKQITRQRLFAGLICFGLLAFSHRVMDCYMGISFYDMRICGTNWHYFVYAGYVFMFLRTFRKLILGESRLILYCFISALSLSMFDEAFQLLFANRVFDISDIAKDSGGVTVGLIIALFMAGKSRSVNFKQLLFSRRKFKDYLEEPVTLLVLIGCFSVIFIAVSPMLTEHRYLSTAVLITMFLASLLVIMFHMIQYRKLRIALSAAVLIGVVVLSVSFIRSNDENITYNRKGLVTYKGIPIPYFDILIYPDGKFRTVDKKSVFNLTDRKFLLKHEPSILLIGSGSAGQGGNGFNKTKPYYFIYNKETNKGVQVIIKKTPEACALFNRLKEQNKNVMFVIHNS